MRIKSRSIFSNKLLAGDPGKASHPMRDLDESKQEIVKAAARFGAETVAPNAEAWDTAGRVPDSFFTDAAKLGLCKLVVPRELDGLGLSATAVMRVAETLAQTSMESAFALLVHNNLAGSVAKNAPAPLIEEQLARMMRGENVGAFLLTEPDFGSDASAITTRAEKSGSDWIINGHKAWVTNGVHADLFSVYAQTEPGAGAKGIACFLIEAESPGVTRHAPYALLGSHALGTTGIDFADCRVPGSNLMIAPGLAFRAAMQGIDFARVAVAAMCCGMLQQALAEAVAYTGRRRAFGQTIGEFQGIQWMLADASTDLKAARLLTQAAAAKIDAGEDATLAAAHAKKYATRVAFDRIAQCMQTMGAAGLSRDYPLARHLAAAKMAQYVDGATEIQNVVIARSLESEYGVADD